MRALSGVIVILLMGGLVGCSAEKSANEEKGVARLHDLEEVFGRGLEWGSFSDHPMREALGGCVVLDQALFLILHRINQPGQSSGADRRAMGKLLGVSIREGADEFERQRQEEKIREKLLAEVERLEGRRFCLELDLYLDEYDFSSGRLRVHPKGAWKIYRDTVGLYPSSREGAHFYEGYAPPMVLKLQGLDEALVMEPKRAEAYLSGLERAERAANPEVSEVDQGQYFTKPPVSLLPGPVRDEMEPEDFFRIVGSRLHSGDVLAEVEEYFLPPEGARVTSAIAVFSWDNVESRRNQRLLAGGEEVEIGQAFVEVDQFLVYDAKDLRVEQVWPATVEAGHLGAQARDKKPDPDEHQEIMDAVCGGGATKFSETRIIDGELREIHSYGCERCPRSLGARRGRLNFEFIAQGSFSSAGAEEALVHGSGCGYRDRIDGGVMSYLRRDLQGKWRLVKHDSFIYSECEFFETSIGKSLPVCQEVPMGEDGGFVRHRALVIDGREIKAHQLFRSGGNYQLCEPTYASIRVEEMGIEKNKDGEEELYFVVDAHSGRSLDGEAPCRADNDLVVTEDERVEFGLIIGHGGLQDTAGSRAAKERLGGLL